ncbi:PhzF family phenazine biosynthesis protein [Clostridium sp. CM028]|uniref:PhzF family phenazine biosynthesis protein n=1 Tax=unclassified Clostridium TaxID=2614128 RepID=UPI001C6E0D94|nr:MULTISPECIES: PhzF family phenazine biosynthesis protein [unclassified Clostridium]MBW9145022.1 PhzF family phenazine biosynthesis protein [Clostridium sp. CM027]MBW9148568.1 PhzF family phenazine biosynthesis protein [Clostridium sp. CM028]UVE40153.1 PhzF family phenazine biosynthesis protein [Clostridium sp. CM027]WLC60833.1 PhzF family phenazine biosynthesis protein [Clostridium sp. CM028]
MDVIKKFCVINSFTYNGRGGNAAAVFIHQGELEDYVMQNIARQLNLVETVYITESDEDGIDFDIRYFTPDNEVKIAGHPTVAAFIALEKAGKLSPIIKEKYLIKTKDGIKEVNIEEQYNDMVVKLKQETVEFGLIIEEKYKIAKVLGINDDDIMDNLPLQCINTGLGHLVVPIKSLDGLMNVKRNISQLKDLCNFIGVREVQVFCFETKDDSFNIHTRNICPREGIEDAACGIGNAAVGAYLLKNHYTDRRSISIKAEQGYIVKVPCAIDIYAYRENDDIMVRVGGTGKVIIKGDFIVSNI